LYFCAILGGGFMRLLIVSVAAMVAALALWIAPAATAPSRIETGGGSAPHVPASLIGQAIVTDGDTLAIAGQRVRLFGVDAFEAEQTCKDARGRQSLCGGAARQALAELVGDHSVTCVTRDIDAYGRLVANCRVGETDLAAFLVRRGHALAYRRYALDYEADENTARSARSGAWSGEFAPPWAWRASAPRQTAAIAARTTPASSACAIKGNIRSDGTRIYHLPDGRFYARTQAEALFCSVSEAEAAGFRRAGL
jgi:endonuclease YncB( thermonuclease family)